ncbi:hypothetical protein C8R45DRAFT_930159 [Mycena sanguinolenta]|nr:hypothetical protein C8R45DRAFT_930159 [Mycena sanguinolenta]
MGFKVGHIAELQWALNKTVLETSPSAKLVTNPSGNYTPSISGTCPARKAIVWTLTCLGGTGGPGGDSLRRAGVGGTGEEPQISLHDVHRFSVISGGIGGAGGASDVIPTTVGTQGTFRATGTVPNLDPTLSGGWGGAGGYGGQIGGSGGLGEAARITAEDVAHFGTITGGFGGAGGGSAYQGGSGGTGQGPRLTKPLFFIDDETRRRLPYTKLEDLGIKPDLCRLLMDLGFQTAGGLFEAHEADFPPPHFKIGHVAGLKVVLRKFAASHT